jgi:hypothetical protein
MLERCDVRLVNKANELDWQTAARGSLTRKGFPAHWQTIRHLLQALSNNSRNSDQIVESPMLPYCCSTTTRREHRYMPTNLWRPGESGNPAGRLRGSRNRLNEEVICALLRDFRKHGEKAIAEVRRTQPGVYLKVIAMVLPREHHKVEHTNPLSSLSDEELAAMIAHLEESIAQQRAGDQAKLIEGQAVETTALPPPAETLKPRRRNKVMQAADIAIVPRACKGM